MLRSYPVRLTVRAAAPSRSFASSFLLTRDWHSQTVVALKEELKTRGLSTKGNKPDLIIRLQEHDEESLREKVASRPLSTDASGNSRLPLTTPPPPGSFIGITIPDIPQLDHEPVQIPYVPDYWQSPAPATPPPAGCGPKVLVVGDTDTHHGAELLPSQESLAGFSETPNASTPRHVQSGGLWDDIAEDLGLPRPRELRSTLRKLFS